MMQPVIIPFKLSGKVPQEIDAIKKSIKGVESTTKGTVIQTNKNLAGIGKGGAKIGKNFASGFSSMLNPAAMGLTALSALLLKIGKNAYTFSKDFKKGMLETETISKAVQEDFDGIANSILNLSTLPIKDTGIDLSKAYYQIVSAGYDGAEGLKLLEISAKAATGGVTETITAADGLTTVMNAFSLSINKAENVADLMFTTVERGKTTMGELSAHMAKVAPLAASSGIEFEQIAAAAASITKQGTPTAEAFTQMKASIVALNKNLGDGWAKTMTYQEGLAKLREMSGGSNKALEKLTGSSEAMLAVLSMTGDKAQEAAADLDAMADSAGKYTAAFNTMGEDADIIWNQFGNQFKLAMKDVGDGLLEASTGLAKFLTAAMSGRDQLDDDFAGIGESVDSFSERMKVLKNEGNDFWSALGGAIMYTNEGVQNLVDSEKAEAEAAAAEMQAIKDEYARIEKEGTAEQLAEFKANLKERYTAIKEETDKELEQADAHAKKMRKTSFWTLGLVRDGSKAAVKAKDIKDQADNFAKILETVNNLGIENQETSESGNINPDNIQSKIKSIQDLEAELKELNDLSGSFGSSVAEAENMNKIVEKTNQIKEAWAAVHAERVKAMGFDDYTFQSNMNAKGTPVKGTSKPASTELATVKKLTDEQKKQLEIEKQQADTQLRKELNLAAQLESVEEMAIALFDASDILGAMANTAGMFDEQLGESLGKLSDMAGQAGNFAANIVAGNWVGAITSGISLLGQVVNTTKQNEEEQNRLAKEYNDILRERVDLLVSSGLISDSEGDLLKIDRLKSDFEKAKKEFDKSFVGMRDREGMGHGAAYSTLLEYFFGTDWTLEDLAEFFDNIKKYAKEYAEIQGLEVVSFYPTAKAQEDYSNLLNIQTQLNLLGETSKINLLSFSGDDVAGSIVDGITSGLENSKGAVNDFVNNSFAGLLRSMFKQELTSQLQSKYIAKFMDDFESAWGDGEIQSDLPYLLEQFNKMAEGGAQMWEAFQPILDQFETAADTAESGVMGAFSSMTQEQASQLEGNTNAMLYQLVDIGKIQSNQLIALNNIEKHTGKSSGHLSEIENNIENLLITQNDIARNIKKMAESQNLGGSTL